MRREAHDHLAARRLGELLVELGHVPVVADAVGVNAFGHLREQHLLLGRPPRAGHAGLGIDDDLVGIDRPRAEQRNERKLRAGGVAAGIGDEPRPLDRVAVELDQPVDCLFLQLGRVMLVAVPARIGGRISEAEVGGEIDHLGLRRRGEQLLDHLLRGRMRQGAEREVERRPSSSRPPRSPRASAARRARTAEKRRRISCPARRSAVSSTISTRGWRSNSRTSSAPV